MEEGQQIEPRSLLPILPLLDEIADPQAFQLLFSLLNQESLQIELLKLLNRLLP